MSVQNLIDRLRAAAPPDAAEWLVLLWTYYEPQLHDVERLLRKHDEQPLRLRGVDDVSEKTLTREVAQLESLIPFPVEFEVRALSLLMTLDSILLQRSSSDVYCGVPIDGFDGAPRVIRRRNNFIADYSTALAREQTWSAKQGDSISCYAPRHFVLPDPLVDGAYTVVTKKLPDYLALHLEQARTSLRVGLWAVHVDIDYPERDLVAKHPAPQFISLRDPRNDEAVDEDVRQALCWAEQEKLSVLLLPELAVSPRVLGAITEVLRQHGPGGFPILTVAGLCHERLPDGGDVNESLLLGPDGASLHVHRKLNPFALWQDGMSEQLDTGGVITVIESPIGNLAMLICLDLFHAKVLPILGRIHANLLLVPSLSPKITAHLSAAKTLLGMQRTTSFVCNRTLFPPDPGEKIEERLSFVVAPLKTSFAQPKRDDPVLLWNLNVDG